MNQAINCHGVKAEERAATVRVIASPSSWIEGDAVRQLEQTAALPGMRAAIGMPDLHPGKGTPIGAAFLCAGHVHPHLIGNDIGCGMALWRTDLPERRIRRKLDRWAELVGALDDPWGGDVGGLLAARGLARSDHDAGLGTIGGGNHFAELQAIESVNDEAALADLGVARGRLLLLVHSGSRGLGESILRDHIDRYAGAGLPEDGDAAARYLARHDHAVAWAKVNRELCARRFGEAIGAELEPVIDVCHNCVAAAPDGSGCLLHRKGAAPSTEGPVVIPGSRGTLSYLFLPDPARADAGWSLAHGAGRKWRRSGARDRLRRRYRPSDLETTALGGRVVCGDRDLLYEEAPEAYKKIDAVVGDLVDAGLGRVIATLRPVLTFKTARRR
ncbi:MAG: RNA ligase RtcB family protein [Myxococcales bacterium]|nr:RNA ligase RtcB family protein [Myxococcales bacterium]